MCAADLCVCVCVCVCVSPVAQERWHLSLASWRYPHDTLDTATVAALQRAAPQLIEQRLQGWRHAFTAAYMAVRHGQACAVYLDTPPVSYTHTHTHTHTHGEREGALTAVTRES